ncbi:MAG: threonine-phosphate decarboxylase [Nitrospira sp.]|jgi:threonine-phosphate decarboxylase|nr:threonine-phosphate decarboxylase [Nitrospira sp.]MBP6604839.1 threonine-phosphate decarboxylase [Nitrospira sp.]MCI1278596.1 threonine-phosphate decarboxylase CobD [Nitrospira sp.]HQY57921.1 threonine-phosphate decarboxylase CobD [Nitrospira sp.]HRA95882.1 threonine-phosphate decarboxylase CobD [Nitrospira sp.]
MTRIGHGGNVYAAARELRRDLHRLLDFSASINPLGPSPAAVRILRAAEALLAHYPDPACWELRQGLAGYWHRPDEQFLIGNGSTELIHLLPRALEIRHLLLIGPTFSEYAEAMTGSGGQVTMLMAERADGYRPPLELVLTALRTRRLPAGGVDPIDAVLLCNPNSPTGQACEAAAVRRLARLAARQGLWCIVDETFAEYANHASILPEPLPARTIVLRSFTKFYGLPGLRVGYAVAKPRVIARMAGQQPPWSVNMLAQRTALAALQDVRHTERSLRFMERERARFQKALSELPGCTVVPSAANFLLMELPVGRKTVAVVSALRRQGLLIRDCSQVPGLNGRSVRVAVRSRADNDRLLRALSALLRKGGA